MNSGVRLICLISSNFNSGSWITGGIACLARANLPLSTQLIKTTKTLNILHPCSKPDNHCYISGVDSRHLAQHHSTPISWVNVSKTTHSPPKILMIKLCTSEPVCDSTVLLTKDCCGGLAQLMTGCFSMIFCEWLWRPHLLQVSETSSTPHR